MEQSLAIAHLVLGTLALVCGALYVRQAQALPRVRLGVRGRQRRIALERGLFRYVEPVTRWLAARIPPRALPRLRARLEQELIRSGSFLGLCADELLALSALCSTAAIALAWAATDRLPAFWTAMALLLGALLPWIVLQDHKRGRDRRITRQLPAALDLFVLALNAGLDFGAGVEFVTSSLVEPDDPLRDELRLLQQELAMGRARMRALRALADRSDAPAVRDLVRVVIQADRKGAPLATVLETQAEVARNRRGVLAEEAAARASIMLLGPLMLMLLAMLLLLIGPLVIQG